MVSLSARRWSTRLCAALFGIAMVMSANTAQAAQFVVTFENLQAANGFTLTPAWVGFHDNTFDTFNTGSAASAALESLAEVGDTSGLSGAFQAAGFAATDEGVLAAPGGFTGAPVVEPGEMASITIDTNNGFFSYASMIIPSNDTFIGNSDPTAFDVSGLTVGGSPLTIDVTRFYDAGTEVNDPNNGAAFSTTGGGGAGGAAEGGVITLDDLASFNAEFLNTIAPTGQVTSALASPIARFTITAVPEPGSVAFFGLFGMGLALVRRRRKE